MQGPSPRRQNAMQGGDGLFPMFSHLLFSKIPISPGRGPGVCPARQDVALGPLDPSFSTVPEYLLSGAGIPAPCTGIRNARVFDVPFFFSFRARLSVRQKMETLVWFDFLPHRATFVVLLDAEAAYYYVKDLPSFFF